MAEDLGKAQIQITATTSGTGGLDQKLPEAEKKVQSWGKRVQQSISRVFAPALATIGAVHVIERLERAYTDFANAGHRLSEEQRNISDAFSSGTLSSGLSSYQTDLERINKVYEQQKRLLDGLAASRDIFTKGVEAANGDPTQKLLEEQLWNADKAERTKAAARQANALSYEAAMVGMSDIEKVEYVRKQRLDEYYQYRRNLDDKAKDEALANINKIADTQIKKIKQASDLQIQSIRDAAKDAANGVFNQADMQVHFSKMVDLLSVIAQQRL